MISPHRVNAPAHAPHTARARRERPARRPWRRGGTQTIGLIVAAALALIFALTIGFFAMRAPKPATSSGAPAAGPGTPPDIKALPDAPGQPNILRGEGMFVQLMDKHDPSRLAGVIESAHVEPLESRRYLVDEPRVWLFFKDGKSLLVEAKTGKLYMPDRTKEPEAGTLYGGTVIRLFALPPEGRKVDPATDEPILTARMDSIMFDGTGGEVSTPDEFVISGAQADFSGRSMRVLFNEGAQRIEYFEVKDQGRLVFRPNAKGVRSAMTQKPSTASPTAVPAPAPERKPVEVFYTAVFDDNVVVERDAGRMNADQLRVWARMVDNQLAPNAIASFEQSPLERGTPAAKAGAATASGATPGAPGGTAPTLDPEETIVLTWTGPLVMKPSEKAPAELERDQIALRFEAPAAGHVNFADPASDATGRAETIRYGLTTRELRLAGEKPENVVVALENSGTLLTRSIGIDLGTGIAHAEGPGTLAGADKPLAADGDEPASAQRVTWNEQADFEFATREGRVTGSVKEAMLAGNVLATDGKGSLKAGFLHASFSPQAGKPGDAGIAGGTSRLTRIQAKEGVRADDGSGGAMNASTIDVAFRSDTRSPTPNALTARGSVVAVRDLSVLQADVLGADFEPPAKVVEKGKDRIRLANIRADGNVLYKDGNDVTARAEELRADVPKQIADLSGQNVVVGKDNSTITSTQLRLDGIARSMEVFGAGTFEHAQPGHARPATATWTKGMTFDDRTGVIIASGDAKADSYPDPVTRDSMRAERVRIEITPAREKSESGNSPVLVDAGSKSGAERELLKVTATGASLERADGRPASIEESLYAEPASEKAAPFLVRRLTILGSTIELDARQQTLTVPSPGQLLVLDRRPEKQAAGGTLPGQSPSFGNAKGSALFQWDGSLVMNRGPGTLDMTRNVQLTHLRLGDEQVTTMFCDHLQALVSETRSGENSREVKGQLKAVVAEGAVRATSGPKTLTAERVDYDALAESMLASTPTPDGLVSVIDASSPTPIQARELFWDLRADRLEVRKPMPIVAPK
jgi:lipopolysaccharide export system protein LptA